MSQITELKEIVASFQSEVETLLVENETLPPNCRINIEEFSLNKSKLDSYKKELFENEEKICRNIELEIIQKQLQCLQLRNKSWDDFRIPPSRIFTTSASFSVNNCVILKNCLTAQHFEILQNTLTEDIHLTANKNFKLEDRDLTWDVFSSLENVYEILFDDFACSSADKIQKQNFLLECVKTRIKEIFNDKFVELKKQKLKLIDEIQNLAEKNLLMKKELAVLHETIQNENCTDESTLKSVEKQLNRPIYFDVPELHPEEEPEKLLRIPDDLQEYEQTKLESCRTKKSTAEVLEKSKDYFEDFQRLRTSSPRSFNKFLTEEKSQWPWVQAQKKRREIEKEEEARSDRSKKALRLVLQLQRTAPEVESLKHEFDEKVFKLNKELISVHQRLHICEIIQLRLSSIIEEHKDSPSAYIDPDIFLFLPSNQVKVDVEKLMTSINELITFEKMSLILRSEFNELLKNSEQIEEFLPYDETLINEQIDTLKSAAVASELKAAETSDQKPIEYVAAKLKPTYNTIGTADIKDVKMKIQDSAIKEERKSADNQNFGECSENYVALIKEKEQIIAQIEMAEERLKEISHIKVGREVLKSSANVSKNTEDPKINELTDGRQVLYDHICKLQKIHNKDVEKLKHEIKKKRMKIKESKLRIDKIQEETKTLAAENQLLCNDENAIKRVDDKIKNEKRLSNIMTNRKLSDISKKKEEEIKRLENEISSLMSRTFPVLPPLKKNY